MYSIQRRALLGITSAYKTTSTEALQVLAGTLPQDLEIALIAKRRIFKDLPPIEASVALALAQENCDNEWQNRWVNSQKARWT